MQNSEYKIELDKLLSGYEWVIGVDEVGRGPLAGPVVAAAVAWRISDIDLAKSIDIRDSKKMSIKARLSSGKSIQKSYVHSISEVSVENIAKLNILGATMLAMRQAVLKVTENTGQSVYILVDGNKTIPQLNFEQCSLISGDALSPVIGAASIIAKVYRDNLMAKLAKVYPQYGFEQHKGYGTKAHIDSIREHGLSPVHRISFCSKIINEEPNKIFGEVA